MLSEKRLSVTPEWVVQPEWLSFSCPIDIDGITVAGYRLQGKTMLAHPDRHVILQLEHHPLSDKGGALCRMEWRPFNGHNNKGKGPRQFRFKEIRCSHHHPFALNWENSEKAVRRGQLPLAVPIDPDPPNFREFLALVGRV